MSEKAKAGEDIPIPEIETDKFQVMPPLEEEELRALKKSIKKNGIQDPVHVDVNGAVIEGHGRADIADELGITNYDLRIHPQLSEDQEKRKLAYALNMQERHLSREQKRELVEQYLLKDWDSAEESLRNVARLLGVNHRTVNTVKDELKDAGKLENFSNFPKPEKRLRVFKYIAEHPDASNRKVADAMEFEVSYKTVGNWRNELEGDEVDVEVDKKGEAQVEIVTDMDRKQAKNVSPGPIVSSRKSLKKAKEVVQAAEEDPEKYGDYVEEMVEKKSVAGPHRKMKRRMDEEKIKSKDTSLPEGKFRTITADPPWKYEGMNRPGRERGQYTSMSEEELKNLDVEEHAAENCHLYLWTTNNFIPVALRVGEAWGFNYKTILTWVKPSIGMGRYFRGTTEHVLFFRKGKKGTRADDISTHFEAPKEEHSAKPERFYEIVEKASYSPYLELFAREERGGWTCWGNID